MEGKTARNKQDADSAGTLVALNWILVICGISMTLWFIDTPPSRWNRFLFGLIFLGSGPYVLLGLGCHISRRLAGARVAGLILLGTLLLVPGAFYAKALIFSSDAQAGFIHLTLPFFMWIYSAVACYALCSSWLSSEKRKQWRKNQSGEKDVEKKTKEHAPNHGQHPLENWMFPLGGILMTAFFISRSTSFHFSIFLVLSGPFLLLGLACLIARRTAASRALGFTLTAAQFSLSLALYLIIYVLAQASACNALGIALTTPFLMWLYAIIASLVLLGRWLRDRALPEPPKVSPGQKKKTRQTADKFPFENGDKL